MIVPSATRSTRSRSRRGSDERLDESTATSPAGSPSRSGSPRGREHAANPRELVACAEAAMMTAKARGKNQVVLFDDSATERARAVTTRARTSARSRT